jgi:hypothetical protein
VAGQQATMSHVTYNTTDGSRLGGVSNTIQDYIQQPQDAPAEDFLPGVAGVKDATLVYNGAGQTGVRTGVAIPTGLYFNVPENQPVTPLEG